MPNPVKDALRIELRGRRAKIPGPARLLAAQALCRWIDTLDLPKSAVIAGYWPVGTELDPRPLMQHLHRQGHKMALCRTVGPTSPLRFFLWQPGQDLVVDILGFPAPADANEVRPDIVLLPLIGFDRFGYRLGQGAGFYDRTLAQLKHRTGAIKTIGIGFACQEHAGLPVDPHDEKLDMILTEIGLIEVEAPSSPGALPAADPIPQQA